MSIERYLELAEQPKRKNRFPAKVRAAAIDSIAEQKTTYLMGVADGALAGVMPGAQAIQRREGWNGEATVCYLNGVGDGIAGCIAEIYLAVPHMGQKACKRVELQ